MHFTLPMTSFLKRGPIVSKDRVEAHYRSLFGQTNWLGLFMSPDSPIDAKLFKIEKDHRVVIGEVDLLVEQAKDCMNLTHPARFPFNLCVMVNDPALNLNNTAVRIGVSSPAEFAALLAEVKAEKIRNYQEVPHLYRFSLNAVESMTSDAIKHHLRSRGCEIVEHDEKHYVVNRDNQVVGCADDEFKRWEFYMFSLNDALAVTQTLQDYKHDVANNLMSDGQNFALFMGGRNS